MLLTALLGIVLTSSVTPVSESVREDRVRYAEVEARSYDVIPDTGQDMGPLFRRMLDTVIGLGAPVKIVLEPGRYRLGEGPSHDAALAVVDANHLVIRGAGPSTELILTCPYQGGIFVSGGRDVRIEDLAIDHDPVPYTQGHILLVNRDAGWFDYVTQAGYPTLDEPWFAAAPKPYGQWGMIFDKDAPRLKSGAADFVFMDRWERLGARVWRMYPVLEQRERLKDMDLGDRFVHMARHGRGGALFFWRTRGGGARNVSLYASQSLAIGSLGSDALVFQSIVIERRPGSDRLLSANADGIHCQQNLRGPLIEDCRFEGMADDSINIYYYPNTVTAVVSGTVLRASRHGVIEAGDLIQIFASREGRVLAETTVQEVRDAPEGEYRITLSKPAQELSPGMSGLSLYNLSRCGAGYEIRNNHFHNHRRHGMMLKAPHGMVENNVIENVGGLGIVIGNDADWPEGVIPTDVVLRNNVIRNVGFSRWYGTQPRGAAIQIQTKADGDRPASGRHVHAIRIENTVVENPPGAAVYIGSARDVTVRELYVRYDRDMPPPRKTAAIIIENAEAVLIEDSHVESARAEITAATLIERNVAPGVGGVTQNNMRISGPMGVESVLDRRE